VKLRKIKKYFKFLSKTPLHPQWIIMRYAHKNYLSIASEIDKDVLDIGSASQSIKKYLGNEVRYIGLDYYSTAKYWYDYVPDIYGDAQVLPIKNESVSNVLMLDVLEHLPYPDKCMREIARVLKPGGKLIIQTPFLYPLHDQPLDFNRWTEYGYEKLFEGSGLEVKLIGKLGKPIETAGLIVNLALCKILLDSIKQKKIITALLIFVPLIVPIVNILSWLLEPLCPDDSFMPLNYSVVAIKNNS